MIRKTNRQTVKQTFNSPQLLFLLYSIYFGYIVTFFLSPYFPLLFLPSHLSAHFILPYYYLPPPFSFCREAFSFVFLTLPGLTVCLEHSLSHTDIFIIIICHGHCTMGSFSFQILLLQSFIPLPNPSSCLSSLYLSFIPFVSAAENESLKKTRGRVCFSPSHFSLSSPSQSRKNEYFLLRTLHAC